MTFVQQEIEQFEQNPDLDSSFHTEELVIKILPGDETINDAILLD